MKSVLVDYRGCITDVVEVGQEFEVYNGPDSAIRWCLCPHDDVTSQWILNYDGTWLRQEDKLETDQTLKRRVAYGNVEDQLDMLYRDIKAGNLADGEWMTHVTNVKSSVPSTEQFMANPANYEGKKEFKFGTPEAPQWNTLPEESRLDPFRDK